VLLERCTWFLFVYSHSMVVDSGYVVEKGCFGGGTHDSPSFILGPGRTLGKGAPREVHVVPVRLVFSRKCIVLVVTYFVFIYVE
jgi:hypothetical protein